MSNSLWNSKILVCKAAVSDVLNILDNKFA